MARTTRGLEWIAAAEIRGAAGGVVDALGHREVRFTVEQLSEKILTLGTVDDAFLVIGESAAFGHTRGELPRIGAAAARSALPGAPETLRAIRRVPARPRFDVTATFLGQRNFTRFEIEDAVGDALSRLTGWGYESRRGRTPAPTSLTVRVHLGHDSTVFAVRLAAVPLHRRPYRLHTRSASLRPPVARAVALLAGLRAGERLLDPFAGAGTIPIEAALAAPALAARGSDIDGELIPLARENARAAKVNVDFEVADARALPTAAGSVSCVATNPPWGTGVAMTGSFRSVWSEFRRVLASDGRVALIGPAELLDGCERALSVPRALTQPIRVLGALVELRVCAPASPFVGCLGEELADAWERYGG